MTAQEKDIVKQMKEEIVVLRLQVRVLTEIEFKKKIDKLYKLVDGLLEDSTVS